MKNDELTWDKKIIFETIFSEAKFSPLKSMIEKIFTTIKEWMQSDEVKDIIKGLAEFQNLSVISQFGWCICDEELKNKISSEISLTKDRMDCLVISYYSENNYQKLKEKLAIWEKAPFLQECLLLNLVYMLQKKSKMNISLIWLFQH